MRRYYPNTLKPPASKLAALVTMHGGTPGTVVDFGDEIQCSSREREPDTWGHPRVFVRWRASRQQIEVET